MRTNQLSVGPRIREDQQPTDRQRVPAFIAREDLRQDPNLAREHAGGVLEIIDAGFDLRDQERPLDGMPPDDIGRAPLAELVEGDLHPGRPAVGLQ